MDQRMEVELRVRVVVSSVVCGEGMRVQRSGWRWECRTLGHVVCGEGVMDLTMELVLRVRVVVSSGVCGKGPRDQKS